MEFLQITPVVFWVCLGCAFFAYIGYPLALWVLARIFGKEQTPFAGDELTQPRVSLLISAYNEEAEIEKRIQTALMMDYPRDKLEIVIASDGSNDSTPAIVRAYENRGVRLLDYRERRGKAAVLNSAFQEVKGDIVLLSDANTWIDAEALLKMTRWFRDQSVGVVVGRLILTDPVTGRNADSLYWKFENFLKACEGRLGALLGANGGIYAIRRNMFFPIPPGTIVDDFVIPLRARLFSGCSLVYEKEAIAREETPPGISSEFHRRARIGAGGFQSLGMLWRLLDPRQGWTAFSFFSHKILRWFCPFFLLGLLVSNLCLLGEPFFRIALLAQAGFYGLSLVAVYIPSQPRFLKVLRLTSMFTGMNAALLVGFWRWLLGIQKAAWKRTARLAEEGMRG